MKGSPKLWQRGLRGICGAGLLSALGLSGCVKANIQFGQSQIDNGLTNVVMIDTMTTLVSTLYLDSVPTSGRGVNLVGAYNDSYFGPISARSYLEIAPPAFSTISPLARFDSLVLYIKPNKYFYGDTTVPLDIYVNRIQTQMEFQLNNSSFFNLDSFPVYPEPIGHVRQTIRPTVPDTVYIPLDSSLGADFFNRYENQDISMASITQFLGYFAGIQLTAGNGNTAAQNIIGFKDTVLIKLWYTDADINKSLRTVSFTYVEKPFQFNEVRSAPIAPLNQFYPGYTTNIQQFYSTAPGFNHLAYVNSLLGYNTKFEFPYLRNLFSSDTSFSRILKADLILRPIPQSFSTFLPLPPQLQLVATDETNEPEGIVSSGAGSLALDYVGGSTSYTFDITAYLQTEINDPGAQVYRRGLILEPVSTNFYTQLDRAVFGDKFYISPASTPTYYQTQVNIYYVSVRNNL